MDEADKAMEELVTYEFSEDMKEMVENNEIRRVGTSQKGHWEIIE